MPILSMDYIGTCSGRQYFLHIDLRNNNIIDILYIIISATAQLAN